MSELKREMPFIAELIDHSGLLIQPDYSGIIMLQQSEIVAKMPLDLPDRGTATAIKSATILSAIPKQWLVFCSLADVKKITDDYAKKIGEANVIITDMSDQYLTISINGSHAKALLAKGCELDLSADVFTPNLCARTLLAHINVIIWRGGDEEFKLIVDVSYMPHLWLWLNGAAAEYTN